MVDINLAGRDKTGGGGRRGSGPLADRCNPARGEADSVEVEATNPEELVGS